MTPGRRALLSQFLAAAAGCSVTGHNQQPGARLTARPLTHAPVPGPLPGLHPLRLSRGRDALLFIPETYDAARPAPLVVSLHGAGGNERHGIALLRAHAALHGFVILSPASRQSTWDIIASALGPDVAFIDRALERAFSLCSIDPARIAIAGFSDGASYALTIGLANGDLFTHIAAFSPGFTSHPSMTGKPSIFISHGLHDEVLPIARCSRRIVPRLLSAGYTVDYREFDGAHSLPEDLVSTAFGEFAR